MSKGLIELYELKDGWFDGKGKRPTWKALSIAASFEVAFGDEGYFYPTPSGGVQIENENWIIRVGPRGGIEAVAS